MRIVVYFLLCIILITPAMASDWNMFKKEASRSGFTTDAVNPPLVLKWTSNLRYNTDSSPVIADGILYIGSNYGIHAIDVKSGKEIWKYQTNGFVNAVPAVVDGMLYVGPDDRRFYAINSKDGSVKWTYTKSLEGFVSSPVIVNNLAYVGSKDSKLHAINILTGEPSWSTTTMSSVESSPAVSQGIVYAGTKNGLFMAFDAVNGKEKWRYDAGMEIKSSPTIENGMVIFGSNNGVIHALTSEKGILKWKYSTGNNVEPSPSVKDGIMYTGSKDGNFYAIETGTGKLKWKFPSGMVTSSAAISNDVVYFGSKANVIYALDANSGQLLWKNSTGLKNNDDITSPAISGNILYAVTRNGMVYAYAGKEPEVTRTVATTAEPTTVKTTETPKSQGFEYAVFVLLITLLLKKKVI
jgi:outer membrane protein assembly factor BamB